MTPSTNHPWWADVVDNTTVIRDTEGGEVCAMGRPCDVNGMINQDAIAELIAMAPELFACLHRLADTVHRCDPEYTHRLEVPPCTDGDWDAALDDAQALLDLLADAGVTLGESA